MKDPIDLQCLVEQMHAIVLVVTDIGELDAGIEIENNTLLVLYRLQHHSHWLKETCFDIHKKQPGKDLVRNILTALRCVESLANICQWQQNENLDDHIKSTLAEVANMATECQAEVVKLWGQP